MTENFILHFGNPSFDELSPDDYKKWIGLVELCDLIGIKYYYSDDDIEQLKDSYETFQKSPEYRKELGTEFFDILELILTNAKPISGNASHLFSIVANFDRTGLKYHHAVDSQCNPIFISHNNAPDVSSHLLICGGRNETPKMVQKVVVSTEEELLRFLGKDREFNIIPKHGENGKGNWRGADPLLCDREHAQQLLYIAIPFPLRSKTAWVWDESMNHYLRFYFEGDAPKPKWHGHHVISPATTTPPKIKRYYGK